MPSCKVLALISGDPELEPICKAIDGHREQFEQKIEFIKKQIDNAQEERKKSDEPYWREMEAVLKARGILSKYNKDTHHLTFSIDSNAVELCENERNRHPLEMIFGPFMR